MYQVITLAIVIAVVSTCMAQSTKSATQPALASQPKAPSSTDGLTVIKNVEYASVDGKPLLMDFYIPENIKDGVLPAVVWIHGGGWRVGSNTKEQYARIAQMAQKGYIGVSVDYRLVPNAIFPAQIEDCKAAIRFVRANAAKYHIDPDRIGVWGSSAGGHLVSLLGTSGGVKELEGNVGKNLDQSSRVQCVVDVCGPTDLMLFLKNGDAKSSAADLVGGDLEKAKDLVKKANPMTYISKDAPPFLILHGDKDVTVDIEHSRIFAKALKDAGV
ncbi:MAG: alpha/beta hydrolase, partial [Planctomycetaceae bacterium]